MADAAKIKKDVEKLLGLNFETELWFGFDNVGNICFSVTHENYNDYVINPGGYLDTLSKESYEEIIKDISTCIRHYLPTALLKPPIKLKILGIPLSKQSARFRSVKMGKKTVIKSYQNAAVVDNERNIAWDVKSQLPKDFVPYNVPIGVEVLFVFPPLESFSKAKKELIRNGGIVYKETKPDLTDNLMKGLFDAMNGIVFTDDARVCKVESQKIYGTTPRITVEIYEL